MMEQLTFKQNNLSITFKQICQRMSYPGSNYGLESQSTTCLFELMNRIDAFVLFLQQRLNGDSLGKAEQAREWFYNDVLGTLDEMRTQLQLNYDTKRILLPVNKKNICVDLMLILSEEDRHLYTTEAQLEERRKQRRLFLEKATNGLDSFTNPRTSISQPASGSYQLEEYHSDQEETHTLSDEDFDQENTTRGAKKPQNTKKYGDKFVLICQPNAALYELSCYDEGKINFYLKNGFSIAFWNYRGYGRSTGEATLENMSQDGQLILQTIKSRFNPSKMMIYGRSLGGHTAKSMCQSGLVDAIILDRTFSNIGYVAREMMGRWAQMFFDAFIDTDERYTTQLVSSDIPKIMMYDPNDEIISMFVSIATDTSIEFASVYFNEPFSRKSYPDTLLKKVMPKFVRRLLYNNKDFDQNLELIDQFSSKLISKNDQKKLFGAIQRIYKLNSIFKGDKKKFLKDLRRFRKINKDLERRDEAINAQDNHGFMDDDSILDETNRLLDISYESYDHSDHLMLESFHVNLADNFDEILEAIHMIEAGSMTPFDVLSYVPDELKFNAFQLLILNTLTQGGYYPFNHLIQGDFDISCPSFNITNTIVSAILLPLN